MLSGFVAPCSIWLYSVSSCVPVMRLMPALTLLAHMCLLCALVRMNCNCWFDQAVVAASVCYHVESEYSPPPVKLYWESSKSSSDNVHACPNRYMQQSPQKLNMELLSHTGSLGYLTPVIIGRQTKSDIQRSGR